MALVSSDFFALIGEPPSGQCECGSKLNTRGKRRFWSIFPLTWVPFWYRFFDPEPYVHFPASYLGVLFSKQSSFVWRRGELFGSPSFRVPFSLFAGFKHHLLVKQVSLRKF